MSTKCTIAYSDSPEHDFHFYRECFDDALYLELRGDIATFECESNRVMVRIPVEVWEVIRWRASVSTKYAGWTDEQIEAEARRIVEERSKEYQKTQPWDLARRFFRLAGAALPIEEQIAQERERLCKIREVHTECNRRIEAILEEDPHEFENEFRYLADE